MSKPTLTTALADFATGGLYSTGLAVASGDPNRILSAGAAPMSPGGVVQTGRNAAMEALAPGLPGLPDTASLTAGPVPTPSDPDTAEKLAAAEASERKKRRRATASLLTSPTGVLGDAPISVKTLLGS